MKRQWRNKKERKEKLQWKASCLLTEDQNELYRVIHIVLIFFHGNAEVESGFSINGELLETNHKEETIVSIRIVRDAIKHGDAKHD